MDYPLSHFRAYAMLVEAECGKRGYRIHPHCFWKYFPTVSPVLMVLPEHTERIFPQWHNERYLEQCLLNLEEKYDRGGIPEKEWREVLKHFYAIGTRRMRA